MLVFNLIQAISRASIAALVCLAITPAHAAGPSFACHGALGPVEQAICGDPELADLDVSMASRFRAALKRDPLSKTTLLDRQRRWLAGRRTECNLRASVEATSDNRLCLHAIYTARIATLGHDFTR